MWKLIQIATFFAVWACAIRYGWAAEVSGLAVSVIAGFAAFLVTAIPFAIYDLVLRLRRNRATH